MNAACTWLAWAWAVLWLGAPPPASAPADPAVTALADEVRPRGWVLYAAPSGQGDWDLFACRPDGSAIRNLTRTPQVSEAYPLVSRDGTRLLYRRLPRGETIDGNAYGTQGELVLAAVNGQRPQVLGGPGEYPWASWSPDGRQIACLGLKGITVINLADRAVVRTIPRQGFFQQMTWSPDGRMLVGVANNFATAWSVATLDLAGGRARAVATQDCCTPDWSPDGRTVVFSRRPGTWTQLWTARPDGSEPRLLYAETGRHVYGGHVSPDGRYVLFTGNMHEDGDPGRGGAPMAVMRLADAPLIGGNDPALRKEHPAAKAGPVLNLPVGWEPCWTAAELDAPATQEARP